MRISEKPFRVYIETLGLSDAESFAKEINDYEIIKNVSNARSPLPYPYSRERASEFITQINKEALQGRFANFSIRLSENKSFLGSIGLGDIDPTNRNCSILFWLGKSHQGKGYAKEACRLLIWYGFRKLGMHKIEAQAYATNLPSIKLLRSLGFVLEGIQKEERVIDGEYEDQMLFALFDSDYADGIDPKQE